jgi:hypothetical protein
MRFEASVVYDNENERKKENDLIAMAQPTIF